MKAILQGILIVLVTLVLFAVSVKAMSPDDLKDGQQKGVAPCVVNGENLVCLIIEHKNETYSIAGFLKEGDFYARYVGKKVKDKWVILWTYGKTI